MLVTPLLFGLGLGTLLTLEEAGLFLLPGDISLVAAGLHASPSRFFLLICWLAGSVGMIVGASVLYHGAVRSRRLNRVLPRRVRLLIRLHGVWGVALARMIPGLRNATVVAAAGGRLSYPRFLRGLVPASFLWSGILLLLGWFGGTAMLAAFGSLHDSPILKMVSLVLIAAALGFAAFRLLARRPVLRRSESS
jgi:membrane protein DedA with SNARE-associated domain